jgi:hypothetical protein
MDAISPEFRLEPTGPGGFVWGDWQIDDGHALMMHRPTNALFSVYPATPTISGDPESICLYDLRARLIHVCDGFPIPENLAQLGASAINAYACWTERITLIRSGPTRPTPRQPLADDDIPF